MYRDVLCSLPTIRLSEHTLDKKCKEEHVAPISLKFCWRTVGPHLKLDEQILEDIKIDHQTEHERRIATLRAWLRVFGDKATYGSLMRAMLKCKHRVDFS